MASNTIKVKLGNVTQNGEICASPTITLLGAPGVEINCYDPDCSEYQLQLPEDFDSHCLHFSVTCDTCTDCPAQVIEKCFCDDDTDCGSCEECIDGVCVAECPPEQCFQGDCKGCSDDDDCPGDQICLNGECVCPAGEKLCNAGDINCSECCGNGDCDVCEVCINGDCKPKDCGTGACDPQTGECVGCTTDGNCGTNECCKNNKCECCEGFVKDNCTGECVPAPQNPCRTNGECGSCYSCSNIDSCTGYGSCLATQCPAGKVFSPTDDGVCCHKPCDCGDPGSCNEQGELCDQYNSELCICISCGTSGCNDGEDCTEGCFCNGDICLPGCTSAPCVDGTNCGVGCGCEGGVCVPCASKSCSNDECSDALGCECKGSKCQKGGCSKKSCIHENDCGDGCTCLEGLCVSCSNFPCTPDNCSTKPGCACNGGVCEDDGGGGECPNSLVITKNDNDCTITGTLSGEDCCGCPAITAKFTVESAVEIADSTDTVVNFKVEYFRTSSTDPSNKLNNTGNPLIAENEEPSGTFSLTPSSGTFSNVAVNKNDSIGSVTVTTPGSIIDDVLIDYVSVDLDLSAINNSTNGCTYKAGKSSIIFTRGDFQVGKSKTILVTSDDCKKPLFTWTSTGEDNNPDGSFRKVYVQGNGTGDYVDTIPSTDTKGCETYSLAVDCGCARNTSKFIAFCNPKFNAVIGACAKNVTVTGGTPCSANADLDYVLKINGAEVQRGLASTIPGLYQSEDEITSVSVGLACSSECNQIFTSPEGSPEVELNTECAEDGASFILTVKGINGGILESVTIDRKDGGGEVTETGKPAAPGDETTNFVQIQGMKLSTGVTSYSGKANFRNCGSVNFIVVPPDCCEEADLETTGLDCEGGNFKLNVRGACESWTVNGEGPYSISQIEALTWDVGTIYDFASADCLCTGLYIRVEEAVETCCNTDFNPATDIVEVAGESGSIEITVPSGGSGKFLISVIDKSVDPPLTLPHPTESASSAGDVVRFDGIGGSYEVVITDAQYGSCASESFPETITTCTTVNTPELFVAQCDAGGQHLGVKNISANNGCDCIDYGMNFRWSASVDDSGVVSGTLFTSTPQPDSIEDLSQASDNLAGAATIQIKAGETGPSLLSEKPLATNEQVNFSFNPNGASTEIVVIVKPSTISGCAYNTSESQTIKFQVNASGNILDGSQIGSTNGLDFAYTSTQTTRKAEVIYFEENPDGSLKVHERSISPGNNDEFKNSKNFSSGTQYRAAAICGCVKASTNPDQCMVCKDNNFAITGFTPDGTCPGSGTIVVDVTSSVAANNPISLTAASDELPYIDISKQTDTQWNITPKSGVYDRFELTTLTLIATQNGDCDGASATFTGTIVPAAPTLTQVCDADPDFINLTAPGTWRFDDGAGNPDGTTKKIASPIVEGQRIHLVDIGNSNCKLSYELTAQNCACNAEPSASIIADPTCVGNGETSTITIRANADCDQGKPLDPVTYVLNRYDIDTGALVAETATGTIADTSSTASNFDTVVVGNAGIYKVTLTDTCGCGSLVSQVTIPELDCCGLDVSPSINPDTYCEGDDEIIGIGPCSTLTAAVANGKYWYVCPKGVTCTDGNFLESGPAGQGLYKTVDEMLALQNINGNTEYTFIINTDANNPQDGCTLCSYDFKIASETQCPVKTYICNKSNGNCTLGACTPNEEGTCVEDCDDCVQTEGYRCTFSGTNKGGAGTCSPCSGFGSGSCIHASLSACNDACYTCFDCLGDNQGCDQKFGKTTGCKTFDYLKENDCQQACPVLCTDPVSVTWSPNLLKIGETCTIGEVTVSGGGGGCRYSGPENTTIGCGERESYSVICDNAPACTFSGILECGKCDDDIPIDPAACGCGFYNEQSQQCQCGGGSDCCDCDSDCSVGGCCSGLTFACVDVPSGGRIVGCSCECGPLV